jgi:tRNA threonylcarbamoyladenosine biosynthesis protein TsaE
MKRGELIYTLDEIEDTARFVFDLLGRVKIIALTGVLGAGKTTLVQAVLRCAGVVGAVQSPTFTYMTYYTGRDDRRYYHFDLYRLNSCEEFIAAGFADYLYEEQSFALVEWPEIIVSLLKTQVCFIELSHLAEDKRQMRYEILSPDFN